MDRLKGKVAIITGAATGMGLADAKMFVDEGAKVLMTDVNVEAGQKAADEIGENCQFAKLDVSKESDWQAAFKQATDAFDTVNVLVNNAAYGQVDDAEHFDLDKWKQLTDVDLGGTMLGIKYAIQAMKDKGGSIINMSSVGGMVGNSFLYSYDTAKWAVRGLTKCAALYVAQQKYPIRINSVHPGLIDTNMGNNDPEIAKQVTALHPMKRMGKPEEVAKMLVFLASDESSFSTGSEFLVDGGYTAQ